MGTELEPREPHSCLVVSTLPAHVPWPRGLQAPGTSGKSGSGSSRPGAEPGPWVGVGAGAHSLHSPPSFRVLAPDGHPHPPPGHPGLEPSPPCPAGSLLNLLQTALPALPEGPSWLRLPGESSLLLLHACAPLLLSNCPRSGGPLPSHPSSAWPPHHATSESSPSSADFLQDTACGSFISTFGTRSE